MPGNDRTSVVGCSSPWRQILALMTATLIFSSAAQAGSWQNNVALGGFSKVHIYTPDSTALNDKKALLLVLHGCAQGIDTYLTANLDDAAEAHGMVIAVPDAAHKAGFSCWSYWQGAVSRSAADYDNLIDLANALSGDPARNIDPDQVYISGLSSGAAFAAQTACLAPDIFAGVAPSAGPTIGTSSNGAVGSCEVVSPALFKSRCEGYAGSYASHLDTQIAVIAHGDADTTVDQCYNQQNANGIAHVYGVSQLSGSTVIDEGGGRTADEHLWQDDRVAMLWLNGLGHSWSGGAGASGGYIGNQSINFASYLGAYFAANNLRVDQNAGPVISNLAALEVSGHFDISGQAVDAEGSVASVAIEIRDSASGSLVQSLSTGVDGSDQFAVSSTALADGLYDITATATDNEGKAGDSATVTARIGPEPPPEAPVISNLAVDVSGQCATVTGTATDANQNLSSVDVAFATGTVAASLTGSSFSAQQCGLAGGAQSATATATDSGGLSSQDSIGFTIDAGSTGDYNFHINEGHITWGDGYSACYIEFGTAEFTMREYAVSGGQCEWVADGEPSCNGPVQACSGGNPPPPDTTAPTVGITAPGDAATVSAQVTINATASDDTGVDRVEFSINGNLLSTDNAAPYSASWDSTSVANGSHQISAQAFDAAGNSATDVHNVTVDNSGGGGGGSTTLSLDNQNANDGYVKANANGSSPAVGGYEGYYGLAIGRGSDGKANRTLLSFDTSAIPSGATLTRAWLTVTRRSGSGSPWAGGNRLLVDISNGCVGNCTIEAGDWGAAVSAAGVAEIPSFSSGSQDSTDLSAAGLAQVNLGGLTQFRLSLENHPASTAYLFIDNGDGATLHVEYQ